MMMVVVGVGEKMEVRLEMEWGQGCAA